jgi:alkanesulfonate monooxygenase SsuD/methylene tetrahydromethanopterin reductase-like flavin-dependent oxidoreductase (luciferase family)
MHGRAVVGGAQDIAEQIQKGVIDAGVGGVIVNLPTHGYTPGIITQVGAALRPVVGL